MEISSALFLLASQNPNGGWGYAPGDASTVESTAVVIMASQGNPALFEVRGGALEWLRGAQNRDGGWGLQADDNESSWHTAWSVLALARSGGHGANVARGVDWLLSVKPIEIDQDAMQKADQVLGIDASLAGWPWLPDQASWVEPTALAVLALAAGPATADIMQRTDEAVAYLANRRCQGGGWNVGNPRMFSQSLPARAHPTAWVLMALARVAPGRVLSEDLEALRAEMESDAGAPAFALGALALRACGQDPADPLLRLHRLQQPDGSWDGNSFHTALAALALAGGGDL